MVYHEFDKVNYSTIVTPDSARKFYYSYAELQGELNELCRKHTLKKVYVSLHGYLESTYQRENYYDFSDFGGLVILILDNTAIEFCIYGTGLVACRSMNLWDIRITNEKDLPPSDMWIRKNYYFYDLSKQFLLKYEDHTVQKVVVDNIDYYAFKSRGLDENKAKIAAETSALPDCVHFYLSNGVDFGIYSDAIEYFHIELKTYEQS